MSRRISSTRKASISERPRHAAYCIVGFAPLRWWQKSHILARTKDVGSKVARTFAKYNLRIPAGCGHYLMWLSLRLDRRRFTELTRIS